MHIEAHQELIEQVPLNTYQALAVKMVISLEIGWIILGSCLLETLTIPRSIRM
jgi:hypothetical protein